MSRYNYTGWQRVGRLTKVPALVLRLFGSVQQELCHSMSQIHKENDLDDDEEEGTNQSKGHCSC
jgi:hypothetical protein